MGIWCREGGTMIRTCSPSVVLAQLGEDYINIVIVNKGLTIFCACGGVVSSDRDSSADAKEPKGRGSKKHVLFSRRNF